MDTSRILSIDRTPSSKLERINQSYTNLSQLFRGDQLFRKRKEKRKKDLVLNFLQSVLIRGQGQRWDQVGPIEGILDPCYETTLAPRTGVRPGISRSHDYIPPHSEE